MCSLFGWLDYKGIVSNKLLKKLTQALANAAEERGTDASGIAYVKNGKYCVVNNTYEPQDTVVYKGDGSSFPLHMDANEIKWYQI